MNEEEQLLVINRLHAVLRPFLLRRVKRDVLQDMPEKKEYLVRIPLTAWQRLLYENLQGKGLGWEVAQRTSRRRRKRQSTKAASFGRFLRSELLASFSASEVCTIL